MDFIALQIGGQKIEGPKGLPKPGSESSIISNAITIFIIAGIILTIIFLIWGGMKWIMSGGDKQKVASARAQITWAIVGLVIIMLSFFIINVFSYLFGVELLNFNFK